MTKQRVLHVVGGNVLGAEDLLEGLGYKVTDVLEDACAILLPGGADISTSLYGQERNGASLPNKARDIREMTATMVARVLGLATIGICRGMQLGHASWGGTLQQHLTSHGGNHALVNRDGTPIEGIGVLRVNSLHHQALTVDELDRYQQVYYSDDGVPEMVVDRPRKFLATQWHPELMDPRSPAVGFYSATLRRFLDDVAPA